jgi:hypothetical protein
MPSGPGWNAHGDREWSNHALLNGRKPRDIVLEWAAWLPPNCLECLRAHLVETSDIVRFGSG